jgi:hypothetical protein
MFQTNTFWNWRSLVRDYSQDNFIIIIIIK